MTGAAVPSGLSLLGDFRPVEGGLTATAVVGGSGAADAVSAGAPLADGTGGSTRTGAGSAGALATGRRSLAAAATLVSVGLRDTKKNTPAAAAARSKAPAAAVPIIRPAFDRLGTEGEVVAAPDNVPGLAPDRLVVAGTPAMGTPSGTEIIGARAAHDGSTAMLNASDISFAEANRRAGFLCIAVWNQASTAGGSWPRSMLGGENVPRSIVMHNPAKVSALKGNAAVRQ